MDVAYTAFILPFCTIFAVVTQPPMRYALIIRAASKAFAWWWCRWDAYIRRLIAPIVAVSCPITDPNFREAQP